MPCKIHRGFPRIMPLTLSHTNLDFYKLKNLAVDNFKFIEYSGKYSKRVENTVGQGKTACNKQFSFSYGVFKRKDCTADLF